MKNSTKASFVKLPPTMSPTAHQACQYPGERHQQADMPVDDESIGPGPGARDPERHVHARQAPYVEFFRRQLRCAWDADLTGPQ